jgi:lipopolysaccharide/colanic/teichoic acid biosynthesis glycosyltransferase
MTAQFRANILDSRIDLTPVTPAASQAGRGHVAGYAHDAPAKPAGIYRSGLKRGLDVLLVLLSLPVTLPVILVSALMVVLDGGRPFYSQERLGMNGRVFRMWKLRSMEVDADRMLEQHLERDPALRAEWDAHQKLTHDPRITGVGRFLRKSSIDELPQIWNILRGDMSIVGPRPMMPNQRDLYPGDAYLRMRPGLTGLWQVTARNNSVFAFRAACDARYERRMSLVLDLKVILSTFRVVFRCTGK